MNLKKLFFLFFFVFIYCKHQGYSIPPYLVNLEFKYNNKKENISKTFDKRYNIYEIMKSLRQENLLEFKETGKGDLIFIEEIKNIKNEGNGKNKKNWLYFVDGNLAEKGISQFFIDKETNIIWCFTTWEEKDQCTH